MNSIEMILEQSVSARPVSPRPVSPRPGSQWCIATVTTSKAIATLTENDQGGAYRDAHPWLVARDLWAATMAAGEDVAVLLAVQEGNSIYFSHYAWITAIEVLAKQLGGFDSICRFSRLAPMHPIWSDIDSVALMPSPERLEREMREDLHVHRFHLTPQLIRPYAICETPAFLLGGSTQGTPTDMA